jgi:hypothetical protein
MRYAVTSIIAEINFSLKYPHRKVPGTRSFVTIEALTRKPIVATPKAFGIGAAFAEQS